MRLTTGILFLIGAGIFLLATVSWPALGSTQSHVLWVPGVLFPGIKRPGHVAEWSSPSSAKVMNVWRCACITQYVLRA